jgi:hypothetical protein
MRMFNWTGRIDPISPNLFAGSAKYGYALYEIGSIRVHKQTRLHSTELMAQRFGAAIARGDITWSEVMRRNGKMFEVETPVGLVEVVVDTVMRKVPLTDATRGSDPMNVFWDHTLVLDRLQLDDFVFVGDAREYRNLVSMALISHV